MAAGVPQDIPKLISAHTLSMLREVKQICDSIPHSDLAIQWDVCIEMIQWDRRSTRVTPFPKTEAALRHAFGPLAASVPPDVELRYHRCPS